MSVTVSQSRSAAKLIILLCAGGMLISACGVRGPLETPPPIFGEGRTEPLPEAVDDIGTDKGNSDFPELDESFDDETDEEG